MHMALVILAGTLLLGVFLLFGKLWGSGAPDLALAAKLFVPVWLLVACTNLWVGTTHGYTVREELPILLVVFAVPALLAGAAVCFLGRG